jgi:hypothetical protein
MSDQNSSTILIAGAGQLGSRHLQGLAKCQNTLDIYVQDISELSLQIARQRWEEMNHPTTDSHGELTESAVQHKITFESSFEKIPKQIDITIVATNADVRPQIVKQITANNEVLYWVLEKILAQSEVGLDEILSMTQNSSGSWTNIPRRLMVWHKKIRKKLMHTAPLTVKVSGALWGLASNGIHLLDLVAWWTGEKLCTIDVSELDSQWIESKRKGFFEITGKITAYYSGGTRLTLESKLDGTPFTIKVEGQNNNLEIDDAKGVASGSDGVMITGKNEMQSEITFKLVADLLVEKNCDLPKLSESVEMHRVFLRSLLEHWNNVHSTNVDTLPIT